MKYQHSTLGRCFRSSEAGRHGAMYRATNILVGVVCAGLIAGVAVAQEPTPNTFVDVSVPQLTGWNEVNYLNVEPGIDGYSGASARTQVYTSAGAKQAALDALADPTLSDSDPENDIDIEGALWTDSPAA